MEERHLKLLLPLKSISEVMRFLILTQYFPPETGAPQNRLFGLAKEMKKKGVEVSVLTAMPNYPQMNVYHGYKGKTFIKEVVDGIVVYRSWIFANNKRNILSRLINYFSFVFSSWFFSSRIKDRFDFILCESPPLFLGIAAVMISRRMKCKLIFNVSDLWPESAEKLGLIKNKFLLNISYKLEKWLYRNSILVTGQTMGICKDITGRFPATKVHWLPNGIDEDRFNPEINSEWRLKNGFIESDFIILYAGILGLAQGLECVIHAAEILRKNTSIQFVFIGDGPEKQKLVNLTNELGLTNVRFFDSVPSGEMPFVIKAANLAVIPLKRLTLFTGAIPSKIFENLAMEKPILLGVEGEAKEIFIDKGKCGLAFIPEDSASLSECIFAYYGNPELANQTGRTGRRFVLENFGRSRITNDFIKKLQSVIQ